MIQPDTLLQPEDDGLSVRPSHPYAMYKLEALRTYLTITNTAMRQKWSHRWYIDLFSGPGKNKIDQSIVLGSPLIALTVPYPATSFIFNEVDQELNAALHQRVAASPLASHVTIYQEDANTIVQSVCAAVESSSLNVAFLDPEGLELHWATVERLAQVKRMDLIITFPTSGLRRVIGTENLEPVNRFFGTSAWKKVYDQSGKIRSRALIDFYRQNLEKFGYHIDIDPVLGGHELRVKTSKNVQIYSVIFASKNPLGDRFWKATTTTVEPPKLPGFDP